MFDDLSHVSWLAVGLAAIVLAEVGGPWFTVVFGRGYAAALGRETAPSGRPAPIFIVGPLLCGLATAVTSAVLMRALGVVTVGDALLFGTIAGLGIPGSTKVNTAIDPNFPRPLLHVIVSGGCFLLSSSVSSLIVVAQQ